MAEVKRIESIDVLRGVDMFMLTGGAALLTAGAQLYGSKELAKGVTQQCTHAHWGEALTCWDLVMPLFIFIVGASMPFAFAKYREKSGKIWHWVTLWRVLRRVVLLFVLGMVVQGHLCSAQLAHMSLFCNTLQAIAEGYLITAVVLLCGGGLSGQTITAGGLILVYWALLRFVPYAGQEGGLFRPDNNLAIYIDRSLQGHWADGTPYSWILTAMSFGALTLMGSAAGELIRRYRDMRSVLGLLSSGILCLGAGWALSYDTPIIKYIYTASCVLWCGGWCLLLLGIFHFVFDFKGWAHPLAFPFKVLGCNAMLAYLLAETPGLQGYSLWHSIAAPLLSGTAHLFGAGSTFTYQLMAYMLFWLFFYFLYRHKAFLRV